MGITPWWLLQRKLSIGPWNVSGKETTSIVPHIVWIPAKTAKPITSKKYRNAKELSRFNNSATKQQQKIKYLNSFIFDLDDRDKGIGYRSDIRNPLLTQQQVMERGEEVGSLDVTWANQESVDIGSWETQTKSNASCSTGGRAITYPFHAPLSGTIQKWRSFLPVP